MRGVCGQLRGVTLERNKRDYGTMVGGGKIVVDGAVLHVERPKGGS